MTTAIRGNELRPHTLRSTAIGISCVLLSIASPSLGRADYDPAAGGWTEVIGCPTSSWDVCPFYHDQFYWGGTGPNLAYASPSGWWTYADPGVPSTDCGQWVNGGIVGGATYEQGQPSVPQGVDVVITTNWWDFENTNFAETCGHQHATTYVWGWRYNGNSWSFEFVTAHQRTSYWDSDLDMCRFQAAGNPDYESFPAFAFGPESLSITDSPYAVLYTKSQATSHYNAGCGEFECFHRVRVAASYSGGPGVNKGVVAIPPPTNELAVETRPVVELDPVLFGATALLEATALRAGTRATNRTGPTTFFVPTALRPQETLVLGRRATLNPTWGELLRSQAKY